MPAGCAKYVGDTEQGRGIYLEGTCIGGYSGNGQELTAWKDFAANASFCHGHYFFIITANAVNNRKD